MGADKLKVLLNRGDMDALSLDYESMDYSDEKTKQALLALLERAKAETGFQPRGAKLYIEVYPCEDGGCALYFTAMRRTPETPPAQGLVPVVFEFENLAALSEAAGKAFRRYGHRIYKSSLFRMAEKYRLVIYPLDYSDRLSVFFLSEYGKIIGEGHVLAAFTQEHGSEIVADTAMEVLTEIFDS